MLFGEKSSCQYLGSALYGLAVFRFVLFHALDDRDNAWDYMFTDGNGIGLGKYILEQSVDADVDWGIFGQWSWFQFSLQQTDGSPYKESLRLNPRQQDFKHSTVSEEIIPVEFTNLPPEQILVDQGSELELTWEWTYVNDSRESDLEYIHPDFNNVPWIFQKKLKPNGTTFEMDMTYWFCSEVNSDDLCPKELSVEKGEVEYTEKAGPNKGQIHAMATLIIRDIQLADQSLLHFTFERSFVSYSMITRLIVAPNTALFPHNWNGVYMHHVFGWGNRYFDLRKGEHALLVCEGLGNSISNVFMGKDRQFNLKSTDKNFLYFSEKWVDYHRLIYAISNVTNADAGVYYCNVDGFGKIATYEKTAVVKN